MKRSMLVLLALALIAAISISTVTAIAGTDNGLSTNDVLLKTMQAANATNVTAEEEAVLTGWNSFIENLDYQHEILAGTINNNTTYREAMIGFASILVLNSQALTQAENVEPSEKYSDFHNYTLNAMRSFDSYLYNMAKFFETRDARYARTANRELNVTMDYYAQGRDEVDFIF